MAGAGSQQRGMAGRVNKTPVIKDNTDPQKVGPWGPPPPRKRLAGGGSWVKVIAHRQAFLFPRLDPSSTCLPAPGTSVCLEGQDCLP